MNKQLETIISTGFYLVSHRDKDGNLIKLMFDTYDDAIAYMDSILDEECVDEEGYEVRV